MKLTDMSPTARPDMLAPFGSILRRGSDLSRNCGFSRPGGRAVAGAASGGGIYGTGELCSISLRCRSSEVVFLKHFSLFPPTHLSAGDPRPFDLPLYFALSPKLLLRGCYCCRREKKEFKFQTCISILPYRPATPCLNILVDC